MSVQEQKIIGEKIRQARVIFKMTQKQLADKVGIDRVSISRTELGQRQVGIIELKKIVEATNQPLSFFLDEKPKVKSDNKILDATGLTDEQMDLLSRLIDSYKQKEPEPEVVEKRGTS